MGARCFFDLIETAVQEEHLALLHGASWHALFDLLNGSMRTREYGSEPPQVALSYGGFLAEAENTRLVQLAA